LVQEERSHSNGVGTSGMSAKEQLVILLGAGATRGALGERSILPPLDRDFIDIARQIKGHGTPKLASRVAKDVFDLYGHVSGVGLEQYFPEIEARGEIGIFAKSKNKPKDWKRRQRALEELIRRVLIQTSTDLKSKEKATYRGIFRHVQAGDTIITFNYDTVIEESIPSDFTLWNPKDGYGVPASGVTKDWSRNWLKDRNLTSAHKSACHLLKLHGSLNWTLYQTNMVRLKPRPYVVSTRSGRTRYDKCAILPPGWHKRIEIYPYRQLWRKARLKLESCSSLAIIGYSMPETDLLARALLAEASRMRAARKQYLKYLHVADPSDPVKERFVSLFASALGSKGRVYRYSDIRTLSTAWARGGVR
jgi:hypothetical protein